jgi:hypothetical protein
MPNNEEVVRSPIYHDERRDGQIQGRAFNTSGSFCKDMRFKAMLGLRMPDDDAVGHWWWQFLCGDVIVTMVV